MSLSYTPLTWTDTVTSGSAFNFNHIELGIAAAYAAINQRMTHIAYYGALSDGTTDDTIAINAAIAYVHGRGGGGVWLPKGTTIGANIILYNDVHLWGEGDATILKLKAGANVDLIWGGSTNAGYINLSGASGTGNTGGVAGFGLHNMIVDGNKANQTSGTSYCLRIYGYGFTIDHVIFRNGYTSGVLTDWNGGATGGVDSMEAFWSHVKIHDSNGAGFETGGPHDSQFLNFEVFNCPGYGIHVAPNATGLLFTHGHTYTVGNGTVPGWLVEADVCLMEDCIAESPSFIGLCILGNDCKFSGNIPAYGSMSSSNGLQIGQQAGQTPYAGQIKQSAGVTTAAAVGGLMVWADFTHNEGSHGAIWAASDGGNNWIEAVSYQVAGSYITGTLSENSHWHVRGSGLTADGTLAKGGVAQTAVNATRAAVWTDGSVDRVNVNTYASRLELVNNTALRFYTGAYTGEVIDIGPTQVRLNFSAGQALVIQDGSAVDLFSFSSSNKKLELPNGSYIKLYSDNYATETAILSSTQLLLAVSGTNTLEVTDGSHDVMNVNTTNKKVEFPNGTYLHGYSDNYVTEKWSINKLNDGGAVFAGAVDISGAILRGTTLLTGPSSNYSYLNANQVSSLGFRWQVGGTTQMHLSASGALVINAGFTYGSGGADDVEEMWADDTTIGPGDVVCWSDDDDSSHGGKLARCTHDGCPGAGIISTAPASRKGGAAIPDPNDPGEMMRDPDPRWQPLVGEGKVPAKVVGAASDYPPRTPLVSNGDGRLRAWREGDKWLVGVVASTRSDVQGRPLADGCVLAYVQ